MTRFPTRKSWLRATMVAALVAATLSVAPAAAQQPPQPPPITTTPYLPKDRDAIPPGSARALVSYCEDYFGVLDGRIYPADPRRQFDAGFCLAYFVAFAEIDQELRSAGAPIVLHCAPAGTPAVEMARIFMDWARANPQRLHGARFPAVYAAIRWRWPCA